MRIGPYTPKTSSDNGITGKSKKENKDMFFVPHKKYDIGDDEVKKDVLNGELSYLGLSQEGEECYINSKGEVQKVLDNNEDENLLVKTFETIKFGDLAIEDKNHKIFFSLLDNNAELFLLERLNNINFGSLLKVLGDDGKMETISVISFLTYIGENYHNKIDKYKIKKIMDKYNIIFSEQVINYFGSNTRIAA